MSKESKATMEMRSPPKGIVQGRHGKDPNKTTTLPSKDFWNYLEAHKGQVSQFAGFTFIDGDKLVEFDHDGRSSLKFNDDVDRAEYILGLGKPKENSPKVLTDVEGLILLVNNPRAFYRQKRNGSAKNLLIKVGSLYPGKFDEIFAVEKDVPESPLMRTYLKNLSVLINEEMLKKDEIDNMEELEKKAYSNSDYIGKSLETVRNEALDYNNYQRYLLTKGEKISITEDDKKFYDDFLSNMKEDNSFATYSTVKERNIDYEVRVTSKSKIIEVVDYVDYSEQNSWLLFFKSNHPFSEFTIEEDNLDVRIGMMATFMEFNCPPELQLELFIVDSLNEYVKAPVGKNTMKKCKKSFGEFLDKGEVMLQRGEKVKSYDLLNGISI